MVPDMQYLTTKIIRSLSLTLHASRMHYSPPFPASSPCYRSMIQYIDYVSLWLNSRTVASTMQAEPCPFSLLSNETLVVQTVDAFDAPSFSRFHPSQPPDCGLAQ